MIIIFKYISLSHLKINKSLINFCTKFNVLLNKKPIFFKTIPPIQRYFIEATSHSNTLITAKEDNDPDTAAVPRFKKPRHVFSCPDNFDNLIDTITHISRNHRHWSRQRRPLIHPTLSAECNATTLISSSQRRSSSYNSPISYRRQPLVQALVAPM